MNNTDPIIFGSSSMYERLCLVTEVLGAFVSRAPRAVGIEQLARQTGRPEKELVRLCNALCRGQLLAGERGNAWRLAGDASSVTLEDAFRFVVNEQAARGRTRPRAESEEAAQDSGARREVDLLVMQAAISINQSVFQHLRQFSLDRLKVAASGMFPARRPDDRGATWSGKLSFS
ncbi:hypothetical protein [Noviherbaspirillum aridicola]|uniref:IclR-like helix-turn-helix domain-containing protein n=1 Tax=Noviherbaspirillum aridicola TaxID=2849687 RepID=A0ABQ4Q775_9BURK|nr:hypothetical protein [Noviherbaspirillum aridicola]GIZ53084.1 hypothetical protein NCCP691_30980 [Noviherbaspirillum aridicola]